MDESAHQRSSKGMAVLAAVLIGASAVSVVIYQMTRPEKPAPDAAGFDISATQERRAQEAGSPSSLGQPGPSSLAMLENGGLGRIRVGSGTGDEAGPAPKKTAAAMFTAAIRSAEAKAKALAEAYTRRYPSLEQYGRDWMGYPDLKKLNDSYMANHDPVKFLHGAANSPNFGKMVAKYATHPAIHAFVKAAVKQAPGELCAASGDLLKEDVLAKKLITNTAAGMGLPPAVLSSVLNGGKVDEAQLMGQVLQSNPGLQGALQDPAVQKTMNDPAVKAKLQSQGAVGNPPR